MNPYNGRSVARAAIPRDDLGLPVLRYDAFAPSRSRVKFELQPCGRRRFEGPAIRCKIAQ